MPDIFISYSRKDSAHALELAEKLRASGVEIWIDKRGIEGAEHWAKEIAEGIRSCSTFLILLSPQSVVSEHVLRELSLAVEKRKRILPVKLMATELPASFEYSLAGLQRVAITDFEGILRSHKNGVERVKIRDERKSLMILPLEDLSPATEDNSWFADGLTGELISALSNIKSLRIPDRKTSMDLKGFRGKTSEIARELDVRYFVEGNVRKFGDEIKISVELLDIDTGDYLWQHSYRGEFKDIFDMQEAVAREVVIGLKLHLTPDEQEKVKDRGTENAEAYELFVKAREYADRNTKEDILLSIQLATTAIELDPLYANAYGFKANSLAAMYRAYDRNPVLLAEAETLAQEALRIKPDLYYTYGALSMIYMLQGNHAKAEAMGQTYVQNDPLNYYSHGALGFFYYNTGQPAKAIALWEEAVRLKPDYLAGLWGCAIANQAAGEEEKYAEAATRAIPYFERYIKLHPDDETPRVQHAFLLFGCGKVDAVLLAANELKIRARDGMTLYNTACLFQLCKDPLQAIETCGIAIEKGYRNIHLLKEFLTSSDRGVASLRGNPAYEVLERMVEKIDTGAKAYA